MGSNTHKYNINVQILTNNVSLVSLMGGYTRSKAVGIRGGAEITQLQVEQGLLVLTWSLPRIPVKLAILGHNRHKYNKTFQILANEMSLVQFKEFIPGARCWESEEAME